MESLSNVSDFSIILKSGNLEESSEYWQEQCQQLYDSICRSLPEGSIEPLSEKGSNGERVVLATIFSTLIACGITGKVFVEIIVDSIKTWLEYRPTAEIELKCPDGSTIKFSKLPLAKLSKFFEENPQLSICEGLNRFKTSKEQ
ncbi:hypothetical protein [Methanomethylovorans sp.]|uniref:hypothetical protein n=1 Tax=Methanomethylovorans sp. TaxID=2758717 RepID=UPI00345E1ECA